MKKNTSVSQELKPLLDALEPILNKFGFKQKVGCRDYKYCEIANFEIRENGSCTFELDIKRYKFGVTEKHSEKKNAEN